MNPTKHTRQNLSRRNRGLVWLAVCAGSLGLGIGAATMASAESGSGSTDTTVQVSSSTGTDSSSTGTDSSTSTDSSSTPTPPTGGQMDPSSLPNGPGETVLTGDTAAKVTAAAEAAAPGSTVIRVETDSSGHAYEAHVKLADGTVKTLYFDESFAADGEETGFGPAPAGQDGQKPQGPPPAASTDSTSGSTTSNG